MASMSLGSTLSGLLATMAKTSAKKLSCDALPLVLVPCTESPLLPPPQAAIASVTAALPQTFNTSEFFVTFFP